MEHNNNNSNGSVYSKVLPCPLFIRVQLEGQPPVSPTHNIWDFAEFLRDTAPPRSTVDQNALAAPKPKRAASNYSSSSSSLNSNATVFIPRLAAQSIQGYPLAVHSKDKTIDSEEQEAASELKAEDIASEQVEEPKKALTYQEELYEALEKSRDKRVQTNKDLTLAFLGDEKPL